MNKDENNIKKLLCFNIVNNLKCVYKNKCLFAHSIDEQVKDSYREFIYKMIYYWNNLSNININYDKELFNELLIFTKECKNCINKKCPGGYNCKFGVCLKELKICYNDLLYGKCKNTLVDEKITDKTYKILNDNTDIIDDCRIIRRCYCGIHMSEKNLIPYYQRISGEINILDNGLFIFNNINYYSKINTLSLQLNDNTIKIAKKIINKNKSDLYYKNINELSDSDDDLDNDINKILMNITNKEYKIDGELEQEIIENNYINNINDFIWRKTKKILIKNNN